MLTSRSAEEDIVAGLQGGADDYVIKPVAPAVLKARVDALGRRAYPSAAPGLETYGPYRFDTRAETVELAGKPVSVTAKEFALALLLFRNLHRALSRAYIFEALWGRNPDLPSRTLDAHISNIRTKLNLRPGNGFKLVPIYAYGYRLEALDPERRQGLRPRLCSGLAPAMLLCGVVQAAPVGVPVAAVLPGPAAQASASTPALVPYTVRPGDNLFRLASRYLIRADDYRVVQKLNHVADPLRLPVGMTLLFPRELLRHEPVRAIVQSSRGTVTIDGRPAGVGAVVDEGMLVTTGDKSFVTLVLPDATSIALPSQSAVRVQRMRGSCSIPMSSGCFPSNMAGPPRVTPMTDPRSTFQFATPGAVTSVRGTRFRMAYDKSDGLATSEVLEGKVGFDVEDHAAQSLPAGMARPVGSMIRSNCSPPGWRDAGAVQDGQGLHFAWAPMAGARLSRPDCRR
jgi:CheY-like chemotaxis protein